MWTDRLRPTDRYRPTDFHRPKSNDAPMSTDRLTDCRVGASQKSDDNACSPVRSACNQCKTAGHCRQMFSAEVRPARSTNREVEHGAVLEAVASAHTP